jgi:hypothetical protein
MLLARYTLTFERSVFDQYTPCDIIAMTMAGSS